MIVNWSLCLGFLAATASACRGRHLSVRQPTAETTAPLPSGHHVAMAHLSAVIQAQFDFQPYELSHACFECSRASTSDLYSCAVEFDWFDPNSVKENNLTSCTCSYSWQWDGSTTVQGSTNTFDPTNYHVCSTEADSAFEMHVSSFTDPTNLTISLSHAYKDSSLWGPPYLYAQTFATSVFHLTLESRDSQSMSYYLDGPVLANITGLVG